MPPSTGDTDVAGAGDATSAIERPDHRVLAAFPETAAVMAIGRDLFGQPGMRHDRKPEVHEVAWRVREGAELLVAGCARAPIELVDDAAADAAAARFTADGKRAHFRDGAAQRRKLRAREHFAVLHGDDEP